MALTDGNELGIVALDRMSIGLPDSISPGEVLTVVTSEVKVMEGVVRGTVEDMFQRMIDNQL